MKKILLIIMMMSAISMHAQENNNTSYLSFRHTDTDKYYTGWMNPRAFTSRFYINYNFDFQDALLSRNPNSAEAWNFDNMTSVLEGRIATEFYFARFSWWGIGFGGAIDLPMIGRNQPAVLNVYGVMGQAAVFIDVFLPHDMKLRVVPVFHESTHLADGYRGDDSDFGYISYEWVSFELYKKFHESTFYGGVEITYHSPGTDRLMRTRMHIGADYRYPIWQQINLITSFNIAAIYIEESSRHPELVGWHPAINMGVGIEFDKYIMGLKYSHQHGFEAATYHYMQNHLGMEVSVLF